MGQLTDWVLQVLLAVPIVRVKTACCSKNQRDAAAAAAAGASINHESARDSLVVGGGVAVAVTPDDGSVTPSLQAPLLSSS